MKRPTLNWMRLFSAADTAAMFATQPVQAELLEKTKKVADTTVHYKVVLPDGYDPAKAYPAILAFGGRSANHEHVVDSVLDRNFRAEAEKRGYIVIAPAAPGDQLFFEDGARIFPEFLKSILADYHECKARASFHIAGTIQRRNRRIPSSRPRIRSTFCPLPPFLDICRSPARPNSRLFLRCASSCTLARMTNICGTQR